VSTTTSACFTSLPLLSLTVTMNGCPLWLVITVGAAAAVAVGAGLDVGAEAAGAPLDEGAEFLMLELPPDDGATGGEVMPRVKIVNDSPAPLAVSWPLAVLQVMGVVPPFTYRSTLLKVIFTWLPAAPVAVRPKFGKWAVKAPVPEPVQVPLTEVGEALMTLLVETILLTVMPFGAVLLEETLVTLKPEPAVTLPGAVAETVKTLPAHSTLVE
jgi:hypothetical protein